MYILSVKLHLFIYLFIWDHKLQPLNLFEASLSIYLQEFVQFSTYALFFHVTIFNLKIISTYLCDSLFFHYYGNIQSK